MVRFRGLMKYFLSAFIFFMAQTISPFVLDAQRLTDRTIHHDLGIELSLKAYHLKAEDRITIPEGHPSELQFFLHQGLFPVSTTPGVSIVAESRNTGNTPLESFTVTLPHDKRTFVLRYGGPIRHPLNDSSKEYARGIRSTMGTISEEGVYLSGSSGWYPDFGNGLITFKLQVKVPSDWEVISQGARTLHTRTEAVNHIRWESGDPQEEIYLIAARFTEYSHPGDSRIKAKVFLRTPDDKLAKRYLTATVRYLAMYEQLIGPYPYTKFALVENFWETGFGMPSFTLLGPKVIRFPFILHSSYPHEILHNWWGNSVFPEYKHGNWTEGLTAYLADHLIKEQRSRGAEHRLTVLQKYTDYVSKVSDFPLTEFKARHSTSTEAVGYGKALMFFHMIRLRLSDKVFVRGLRDFYRENRFRFASFKDLQQSFEKVAGLDLGVEFSQWIRKVGAPKIIVRHALARAEGEDYLLTAVFEQVQQGEAFHLRIPVALTLEGKPRAFQFQVTMEGKRLEWKTRLPSRPLRIDVDPEFDLFRKLDRDEIPPALTQAFGANKVLILLPGTCPDETIRRSYRELARSWSRSGPNKVEVKLDTDLEKLPSDRAVALFGWDNRFRDEIASALSAYDVKIDRNGAKIGETNLERNKHSLVFTARHSHNKDMALTWVAADIPRAVPGLGRKLPHYHKYSYLGFKGEEPVNFLKGRWPVLDSPMTIFIPGESGSASRVEMGELAPREPLATLPPLYSGVRKMETVRSFTSDELAVAER
jgi:aminopeptidase N